MCENLPFFSIQSSDKTLNSTVLVCVCVDCMRMCLVYLKICVCTNCSSRQHNFKKWQYAFACHVWKCEFSNQNLDLLYFTAHTHSERADRNSIKYKRIYSTNERFVRLSFFFLLFSSLLSSSTSALFYFWKFSVFVVVPYTSAHIIFKAIKFKCRRGTEK